MQRQDEVSLNCSNLLFYHGKCMPVAWLINNEKINICIRCLEDQHVR